MSIFNKLHHICIVVHDLDRARAYFESVEIGPWIEYPPLAEYSDLSVPNPDAFMKMRYQVCNIGNAQLQLCQPPEQDCPQRRFLNEGGEGVFHIGFEVPDVDAAEAKGVADGLGSRCAAVVRTAAASPIFDRAHQAGGVTLVARATPAGNKI